jgi:cobalt/nickel transport system permease protein
LVRKGHAVALAGAFTCGFTAVLFAALVAAAALMLTGEAFLEVSIALIAANIFVMIIEGIVTLFCVGFLKKVQPAMLPRAHPPQKNARGKG